MAAIADSIDHSRPSTPITAASISPPVTPSRSIRSLTPNTSASLSPPATPSKSADENGKRKMHTMPAPIKLPASRRGDFLAMARTALITWRFKTMRAQYYPSSYTSAALLPDSVIKTLSSAAHIRTIDDIKANTQWLFVDRHGSDILRVLKRIDDAEVARKESVKAARQAATAARISARKVKEAEVRMQKQLERNETRREREELQAKERAEKQLVREQKARLREAKKVTLAAKRAAKRPKTFGDACSTLALGIATPAVSHVNDSNMFSTPLGVVLDFQVILL